RSTRPPRRPPLAQILSTKLNTFLFILHLVFPRVSNAWVKQREPHELLCYSAFKHPIVKLKQHCNTLNTGSSCALGVCFTAIRCCLDPFVLMMYEGKKKCAP